MVSRSVILQHSHAPLIADFWTWIAAVSKDDAEAFASFDVTAWALLDGALVPDIIGMPEAARTDGRMTWPQRAVMVELIAQITAIRSRRWRVDEQRVLPVANDWKERLEDDHVYNFLCEMSVGPGWADLLNAVVDLSGPPLPRFSQIKEKFGSLRAYYDGAITPRADALVTAAEFLSGAICEDCGRPGRRRHKSWILTLCDEHAKKRLG